MGTKKNYNVFSPDVEIHHPKICSGCRYTSYKGGCDYIIMTGHMRGCPAGNGCTRFEPKGKVKRWDSRIPTITEWQQPADGPKEQYKINPPQPKPYTDEPPLRGFKSMPLKLKKERDTTWITNYKARTDSRYRPLYDAGMNDRQIAEECHVTVSTVQVWRTSRGLRSWQVIKSENKPQKVKKPRPNVDALYMPYYKQGLSDSEIAAAVGVTMSAICSWRLSRKLPNNMGSHSGVERYNTDNKYGPLYEQGMSDIEIAERCGVTKQSIYLWRHSRNLKYNKSSRKGKNT